MSDSLISVGVLGCAHTAHAASYIHWLSQLPGVEVASLYDDDSERAQAFADRFAIADVQPTSDRVLAREDIQAVVICSQTDRHAALTLAAAAARKHVLCEKPIATQLADARAMVSACAAAGVQLHIPFVCRFYPMVQAAKAAVERGDLGPIQGMVGGNRGRPPLPPRYPDWITDPVQAGGGALIDHSVHVTDVMRHLTGAEVESVFAESGTLIHDELAVDDCALLLLRFQNNIVASVDPSWSLPAANPYHYDFYLRVLGGDGLIVMDDTQQALRVASDKLDSQGMHLEPFGVNVDAAMIEHFVRCLRVGQQLSPAANGEDGLAALEIALAAYESARRGQPVRLPLEPLLEE